MKNPLETMCESYERDQDDCTECDDLEKEPEEAREYILATDVLIKELVSEIETKDELLYQKELEVELMTNVCKYAISTLQSYEQSIRNFGLLFGNGKECIRQLKLVIGEQE